MTPAVRCARKAGVAFTVHEYEHGTGALSWGEEAANALGVPPEQVFKTLLIALTGHRSTLAVTVIPVNARLSLKAAAKALGAKKAEMAEPTVAEKTTGYVVGGISPLGQKKALPTLIDASASAFERVYMSAGRRGLEISLSPSDLQRLTRAEWADLAA